MANTIAETVRRWAQICAIPREYVPSAQRLLDGFGTGESSLRPPLEPAELRSWELRYDVVLPPSLRAWLLISNGFYRDMPLVHPLSAIGPIVLFGYLPGMFIQPETWYELGNPNVETIGVDLAYHWPDPRGDCPIFTSGDQSLRKAPRVIAHSFTAWFLRLLEQGGREFWMEPGFQPLGDAWSEHRKNVPQPSLPTHLKVVTEKVERLIEGETDERTMIRTLDLQPSELEQILRHLQHRPSRGLPAPRPAHS